MEQFLDEKHPELNSLTSKVLRDHVSSIAKHKVVMETDFDLQNQNIEQTNTDNSDTAINDNTFVNDITRSGNSLIIIEQITPEVSNIKQFKINFETILTANLKDWQVNTKRNKNLDKNIIIAVNDIAKEILESIESPNYHDINCLIYAGAVTCKAYIQDIQQKPANQKESNTLPKCLHHLEQSINRVRKKSTTSIFLSSVKKKTLTENTKRSY